MTTREMTGEILADLYSQLEKRGIRIWIDGGWGVDALLEKQTRPHDDVDFVVQEKDVAALDEFLRATGYKDVLRDDTRAWNYVLGNDGGSEIDIHVINISENGDGVYGPPENGQAYPAYALKGVGIINGQRVACMSLEYQLVNHTGYKSREKDIRDIKHLCEKFGTEPPEEYQGKI
jgi:lincosamide nucleotidyltransferase A/C/D/E